ncbi:hypothetical protein BUH_1092 [Burkholderia pseudomallei Pakistan 9]|nr:hypothetical protein BUH_1092 [Burkholderia pseudomallei Pakistan 9]
MTSPSAPGGSGGRRRARPASSDPERNAGIRRVRSADENARPM